MTSNGQSPYICKSCHKEWSTNYCPECQASIDRTVLQILEIPSNQQNNSRNIEQKKSHFQGHTDKSSVKALAIDSKGLLERPDLKPELKAHGIASIGMGLLHFFIPALAWQWGVVLILGGLLCLICRSRFVFLIQGTILIAMGIWNIILQISAISVSGYSKIWVYIGLSLITSGGRTIQLAWQAKFSDQFLISHLDELHTTEAQIKALLATINRARRFDIKKGLLIKLADYGQEAQSAVPDLDAMLNAKRVADALKVWCHYTIAYIENDLEKGALKITNILLKKRKRFGNSEPEEKALNESIDALAKLGRIGLTELLHILENTKNPWEMRTKSLNALADNWTDLEDTGLAGLLHILKDDKNSSDMHDECIKAIIEKIDHVIKSDLRAETFVLLVQGISQEVPVLVQKEARKALSLLINNENTSWIDWWKRSRYLLCEQPEKLQRADRIVCKHIERRCNECGRKYQLVDYRDNVKICCLDCNSPLPNINDALIEFESLNS